MTKLSPTDRQVLKALGTWNDDTIYSHHLYKVFFHRAARASALVVRSKLGYTRRYIYYYRWIQNVDGNFYPSAEFYEDHQPSLRACVSKVKAWEKENAL